MNVKLGEKEHVCSVKPLQVQTFNALNSTITLSFHVFIFISRRDLA